ncbi:hypothetical protein [Burkholderia diffusa]|uniref:hypothetical protein n=1 Tax=Burkholderia diffusa TaxID=488732 RepID=UPI001582B749|nr:hypothetical protein [Burkholderia diffusa]
MASVSTRDRTESVKKTAIARMPAGARSRNTDATRQMRSEGGSEWRSEADDERRIRRCAGHRSDDGGRSRRVGDFSIPDSVPIDRPRDAAQPAIVDQKR